MNAVAQTKPKLNVGPVTPPSPAAKFATADPTVSPFTQMDIAKWGEWLLTRMAEHFPHVNAQNFTTHLASYMGAHGIQFIRTDKAIALATVTRGALEARQVCDLIFLFKHSPEDDAQTKDAVTLLHRVNAWARSHDADIRISHPERCDVKAGGLKDVLGVVEKRILGKDLVK